MTIKVLVFLLGIILKIFLQENEFKRYIFQQNRANIQIVLMQRAQVLFNAQIQLKKKGLYNERRFREPIGSWDRMLIG